MQAEERLTFNSLRFRWVYSPVDTDKTAHLVTELAVAPPVAEIFVRKGLETAKDVHSFIETPLNDLLNPFEMKDMSRAVERICQAMQRGEKICIYGDYDVDGVTSTALLHEFFRQIGYPVDAYIPNRLEEGYGLNCDAMDEIASRGVQLLITVDCGVGAHEEITHAASVGMDVIVTDHHQAGDSLPEKAVAVVNPMRPDCGYPFKGLSGVGVAFKLVMALRYQLRHNGFFTSEPPNIKNLLDIVTLGTIADVVPLVGENRIFVRHGLELLATGTSRPGLKELKRITGLDAQKITSVHVGFVLAPRINAVGRMGNSDRGLRLLITQDKNEARWLAEELDMENKYRQSIEKEIMQQSFEMVEKGSLAEKYRGLVLYHPSWHPGVIGIVASRVVERFFRPTVILTDDNGVGKGSARSIPAFHLYDGLSRASDMLLSFGGHKYAAGVKLSIDNLEQFRERFDGIVRDMVDDDGFIPELKIDSWLEPEDVSKELMEWIAKLEPFGPGNREPVFCMRGVRKYQEYSFVGKESNHLKIFFEKRGRVFECIGYNMRDCAPILKNDGLFDIVFVPVINRWNGGRLLQFNLKDLRVSEQE